MPVTAIATLNEANKSDCDIVVHESPSSFWRETLTREKSIL
jgi:hypothetical protein